MGMLDGKIAVITGSSRGLGLAIARAYSREGAKVVISSRSESSISPEVESLSRSGAQVTGFPCDVADLQQVEALARHAIATFGGIDIWVNNAGQAGPYGPTAMIDPTKFTTVLRTNIFGTYHGSLVALRCFLPKKSGKLINILGRGEESPAPMQISYGSSKAWERSFTLALAKENRESGVGIYAFNPGLMITDFLVNVTVVKGYAARLKPFRTIIRMWGNYPDVPAEKAVWLASNATDGKTGLLVRQSNPLHLFAGALRQGVNMLMGKPNPIPELNITEVVPVLPPDTL